MQIKLKFTTLTLTPKKVYSYSYSSYKNYSYI